jgi:type 1 glutamine amidotransferase
MTFVRIILAAIAFSVVIGATKAENPWVVYEGGDGPGKGKKIVLVSGDEEYRSEEGLPQLGKILAKEHGFHCTVVFAIDPKDGTINPNVNNNIPGLEALDSADLMIIATRFRDLPDEQMKHVVDFVEAGKPIIGIRTATHAFNLGKASSYKQYTWNNKGGFGVRVLGETWVSHHGNHGKQSTRGLIADKASGLPILRGIKSGDIWGPTDVYGVHLPFSSENTTLVMGQVLQGMKSDDAPVDGKQNDPMMPLAWTRTYHAWNSDATGRAFTTTMGASQDLESEGLRRLIVNAVYWGLKMEDQIPATGTKVDIVGEYQPTRFGFNGYKRGVKPSDHEMK